MDEISSLSREIEFHEKFRGYDPDEVDAYVDKVRSTAALAMGRISELHDRAEAAEDRIAAGRGDSTEETLARTLLLAQRTADELVQGARAEADELTAEARTNAATFATEAEEESTALLLNSRTEAETLVRGAEERTSLILAEAETDRRATITQAKVEATAAATEERERLAADVSSLRDAKAFLDDDISILERHVDEQRANLTRLVSSLSDLIENPGSFRVASAPATSGVDLEAMSVESGEEWVEVDEPDEQSIMETNPPEPDPVVSLAAEPEQVGVEVVEVELAEVEVVEVELAEVEVVEPEALEAELLEVDFSPADIFDQRPAEVMFNGSIDDEGPSESSTSDDDVIDLDDVSEPDPTEAELPRWDPAPPRLLTVSDFTDGSEADVSADPGPATAPVGVIEAEPLFAEPPSAGTSSAVEGFGPDDSIDGRLLTDDSDALSAFFDQDDDEADRSWFGRRR